MAIKTIVLVHGAFADGSCWAKVIPLLTKRGLKAIAVQNPLSSLADDVIAAHRVIGMQDGPVLLAGHSWGGAVITEAGNHPQVKGLVYIAAGAPDSGQSFADWWKDYSPAPGAAEIKPYGDGYVALTLEGVRKHFVQDLPRDEADIGYATQGPLAVKCFGDKITKAAWRSKPNWYIVASEDQTIPPSVERDSASRMGAETRVLKSSHVPMLSQPDVVAEFIANAAAIAQPRQAAAQERAGIGAHEDERHGREMLDAEDHRQGRGTGPRREGEQPRRRRRRLRDHADCASRQIYQDSPSITHGTVRAALILATSPHPHCGELRDLESTSTDQSSWREP